MGTVSNLRPGDGTLAGGSEPPHDGGMEARLARIESRVDRLTDQLADLRTDVATSTERLSHVATKAWVLGGLVATLLTIIGAAWWMAQQYLGPILQHLGK